VRNDSELSRNRKKFIAKHLYRIDGKASQRVADLVHKMTEPGRP